MKKTAINILFFFFALFQLQAQIETPVKWDIKLEDSKSSEKSITFSATIDKGWHLYDMNLPEGGPVSTSFTFTELEGAELTGNVVADRQPAKIFDNNFQMELSWYENAVVFTQKLKVTDPNKLKIAGEVEYMVCNDETCLPPEREDFLFGKKDIDVNATLASLRDEKDSATPKKEDTLIAQEEQKMTASEEAIPAAVSFEKIETTTTEEKGTALTNNPSLWEPVIDEMKAFGDATLKLTDTSWLFIFLSGFLGGLLAILTPCVWPMIPMTVSFFLKRSKNRKKAIRDAVTYGLSIIVIYLALGLLLTGIFGAGVLNDLSTNAIFNILFFLLLIVFAISFFGTVPIIATLLVQAASMVKPIGPAIGMFGFALALSIPFSIFAIFPNLLQNMPKSGGWLNSVKVVLGFLELALALKFLSVADLAYGWRILDREVFLVLWIVIFALLGFYLLGKLKFSHDSDIKHVSTPRLFLAIISFSFSIYMVPGLWGAPLKAISAFSPPLYTQDFNLYDNEVHAAFNDYDLGMAYAKQTNKPVLIDFSGYGCVNCRKMEASVWTDPRVKHKLETEFVLITLMLDDKAKLKTPITITENGKEKRLRTVGEKWSYLQRSKFGVNAMPFYVILDHDGKPLAPSYAFDENVTRYIQFLDSGLNQLKKQ